jgi:hypothetical protein
MTIINGHYDGKCVVLDEPLPPCIDPDTPVRISFGDGQAREVLAELAKPPRIGGLPRDFSEQHEHYVKGTPRK